LCFKNRRKDRLNWPNYGQSVFLDILLTTSRITDRLRDSSEFGVLFQSIANRIKATLWALDMPQSTQDISFVALETNGAICAKN